MRKLNYYWYKTIKILGDLLRAERKTPGSQHGETIEHHIVNGTIVPVAITCSLLERAMTESGKNDFLIDGFPRDVYWVCTKDILLNLSYLFSVFI